MHTACNASERRAELMQCAVCICSGINQAHPNGVGQPIYGSVAKRFLCLGIDRGDQKYSTGVRSPDVGNAM